MLTMPIPSPHHTLTVQTAVGALRLSATLDLTADWTLLFGPSGSGKSSLLRAAAGLLGRTGVDFVRHTPTLAREVLQDPTRYTPPHLRSIRWAPQHSSLFPHLSVHDNIRFSAEALGGDADADVQAEVIRLFRLKPLLQRRPASLSGGERQRVNLARAFAAPRCRLMLLDEPFNGIDRPLRDEMLPQMRSFLRARNIPTLSVTHDIEEAFLLQPDVFVIDSGRVVAHGDVASVLQTERERMLSTLNV